MGGLEKGEQGVGVVRVERFFVDRALSGEDRWDREFRVGGSRRVVAVPRRVLGEASQVREALDIEPTVGPQHGLGRQLVDDQDHDRRDVGGWRRLGPLGPEGQQWGRLRREEEQHDCEHRERRQVHGESARLVEADERQRCSCAGSESENRHDKGLIDPEGDSEHLTRHQRDERGDEPHVEDTSGRRPEPPDQALQSPQDQRRHDGDDQREDDEPKPVTRWNTNTVGCSPRADSRGWLTASPVSPSSTRKRCRGRNARSTVFTGSLPTAERRLLRPYHARRSSRRHRA